MKLKILKTDSAEIPVVIRDSVFTLISLMDKKTAEEKKNCCDEIKEDMQDNNLSQWFMLFVRVIFRYVYAESDTKFANLLSLVKEIDPPQAEKLELLRNGAAGIGLKVAALREEQHRLIHSSHSFGLNEDLIERDTSITKEIEVLEEKIQSMRGLFLIIEKIVVILLNKELLNAEKKLSIQEKMLENPIRFIANLSPILLLLQKGEEEDLKTSIQLTIELIDLKDRGLATTIEEELYNQNFIELIRSDQKISAPSKFTRAMRSVYSFFCCRSVSIKVNPPSIVDTEPQTSSELKLQMNCLDILETIPEEDEEQAREQALGIP